jgi:hypothetical protein
MSSSPASVLLSLGCLLGLMLTRVIVREDVGEAELGSFGVVGCGQSTE